MSARSAEFRKILFQTHLVHTIFKHVSSYARGITQNCIKESQLCCHLLGKSCEEQLGFIEVLVEMSMT